jgi:hypothetical protein
VTESHIAGAVLLLCGLAAIAFRARLARGYARFSAAQLGLVGEAPAPRLVRFIVAFGAFLVVTGAVTLWSAMRSPGS